VVGSNTIDVHHLAYIQVVDEFINHSPKDLDEYDGDLV